MYRIITFAITRKIFLDYLETSREVYAVSNAIYPTPRTYVDNKTHYAA